MDFHAASTLSFPTREGGRGKGRPRDDRSFPVSTVIRGTGRRTFVQPLVGLLSWRTGRNSCVYSVLRLFVSLLNDGSGALGGFIERGEIESRIFIIVVIFNDLENLDYAVSNFDVI